MSTKFTPIAVWRIRISSAAGGGNSTSATSSCSTPPGALTRTTLVMAMGKSLSVGSAGLWRRREVCETAQIFTLNVRFCTMSDWEDIRHFVTLAREGTLSAAARTLGVDHATVARRVAALETSTGLKLVDRRPRTTTLTEDGKRIAAVAAPMEEAAFALGRTAQAAKGGVGGDVTISAPPNFASSVIAPQLVRLRRQHPDLRIKLIGEKR